MELTKIFIIITLILLFTIIICIIAIKWNKRDMLWHNLHKGDSISIKKKNGKWCRKLVVDKTEIGVKIQHIGLMSKSKFLSNFDGQFLNI